MLKVKKYFLIFLMLVFVGICLFQAFKLKRQLSEYRNDSEEKAYQGTLSKIEHIVTDGPYAKLSTQTIKNSMAFVHDNSIHSFDKEHSEYAYNIPFVVYKLLQSHRGAKEMQPHLSCGPRSFAMQSILDKIGIYSRVVQLYSDEYGDTVRGHRLLEVFNPETNSWQVWDPDYNVTYIDLHTSRPVDALSLITLDTDRLIPENNTHKGWQETHTEELKNYLKAVSFENDVLRKKRGTHNILLERITAYKNSIIIVNTLRFNLKKNFSGGYGFETWAKLNIEHPRFIFLPINVSHNGDSHGNT